MSSKNVLGLRNVENGDFHITTDLEDAIQYSDAYEEPNNLIGVDVLFFDGAGYSPKEKVSKIAYGKLGDIFVVNFPMHYTNNEMEYLSLISALILAKPFDIVKGDSQLVINQVQGVWNVKKEHLKKYHSKAVRLIEEKNILLVWARRTENFAGIELDLVKGK